MTLPFKLRVLHALTDAIKTITPGNGYVSDLADFDPGDGAIQARVFRGRQWFGETDPIPMVSILEMPSPADEVSDQPINAVVGDFIWSLLIQGFVDDDPLNPTDPAYVLMADVRRKLAAEKQRRDPEDRSEPLILGFRDHQVRDLRIGGGVVRPADDVSAKAYFWLLVDLVITDDASKPYA